MLRIIIIILSLLSLLPVVLKSRATTAKSAPVTFLVTTSGGVLVRVAGDVKQSGIYSVSANSLAEDVIIMAIANASATRFVPTGIASRYVENGSDIHIKIQKDGTAQVTIQRIPVSERIILGIPLDINAMNEVDFERLPGVGAVMARRIVEYRQNIGGKMRVFDLQAVEGIGELKYKTLSEYF